MAVVFKYKSPISQTYAPGMSRPGAPGPDGIKGKSGNALYFIDFDLDNSYNIEQALQKIDNNKILSINSDDDLKFRTYQVNDILLSNTGKCYRIKENSSDSLFSNYSYDIEYLGEMNRKTTSPVKFVVIYDFTNAVFYKDGSEKGNYSGDIIKMYGTEELSCYITNRTEKPYTSKFSISNKDYSLIGSWIKIVGYSTEDTTPKFDPINGGISGAKHSFVIQLNNNKNISCNSIPVTYNGDVIQTSDDGGFSINFKKKLEYPNIKTFDNLSLSNKDFVNSLLYEIIPNNNLKISYEESIDYTDEEITLHPEGLIAKDIVRYNVNVPECTTAYLSDYSMDDVHPSGNNIKCTINNDRTMWFRSGVKAGKQTSDEDTNTPTSLSPSYDFYKEVYKNSYVDDNDEEIEYSLKIKNDILESLKSYGAGLTFTPVNLALKEKVVDENGDVVLDDDGNIQYTTYKNLDSSTSTLMSNTSFPQYAIGLSLSTANEDEIQKEISSLYRFGFIYDGTNIDNDYVYRTTARYGLSNPIELANYTLTGNIDINNPKKLIKVTDNEYYWPQDEKGIHPKLYLTDVNGNTNRNVFLSELNTYKYSHNITYRDVAYDLISSVGDNEQFSNILQYPKYPSYSTKNTKYFTNYKGGNSLYFSGINDPLDTYENIFNYITNKDNTFSIVTTFEKTKEMIVNVIPIIVDTSFKNSKVYLKFGQGGKNNTIITGLRIHKGNKDIANYTYR